MNTRRKFLAFILILMLLLNMILFAARVYDNLTFWIMMILVGGMTYFFKLGK